MARTKRSILNEYRELEDAPIRQSELLNTLRDEYDMTLREIGEEIGKSRQMVHHICKRVFDNDTPRN